VRLNLAHICVKIKHKILHELSLPKPQAAGQIFPDFVASGPVNRPGNRCTVCRRSRVAGLRSSFAASGSSLSAMADGAGAAAEDNGDGDALAGGGAEPVCGPLQQVRLLFGRSWCAPG
jgi:hypothetical protein